MRAVGGLDNAVGVLFDGDDLLVTSRDTHQILVFEGPSSEYEALAVPSYQMSAGC